MNRCRTMICGVVMLVSGQTAGAQDAPVKRIAFTADLGFVSAAGNTSVTTLNVGDRLVIKSADERVVFTQHFNAVRSESDGVRNAENYKARVRLDYGVGDRFYLFTLAGWDRNVPGGVARRFEETAGVSWQTVSRPRDALAFEVGVSFFQQKNTEAPPGGSLESNYTAGHAAARYKHTFTKAAFFAQEIELIPSFETSEDFRFNSETALVAPLSANIGLRFAYLIQFDNLPGLDPAGPAGARLEKTDRFLTAGITISF